MGISLPEDLLDKRPWLQLSQESAPVITLDFNIFKVSKTLFVVNPVAYSI